jgi:hypothetical protein
VLSPHPSMPVSVVMRTIVDAGRRDNTASPGIVAGMRQRSYRAHIAGGRYPAEPSEACNLKSEPVSNTISDSREDGIEIFGVLVEIDWMNQASPQRRHLRDGIAGLLKNEGYIRALLIQGHRMYNRQTPIAIRREPGPVSNSFPNLSDTGDILFDGPATNFQLQPLVAALNFVLGDPRGLVSITYDHRVVGEHPVSSGATEECRDGCIEFLPKKIEGSYIEGRFGVTVAIQTLVHALP